MRSLAFVALGIALGLLGSQSIAAVEFARGCAGVRPQSDAFVRWAERRAQWRPGDVKFDPQTSPPVEAQYCGTRISGRLYAIYVLRVSP